MGETYAVVEVGGSQKIVQQGRYYTCNRVRADIGSTVQLSRVLAVKDNGKFHMGSPWMVNASVDAELLEEFKGDKVIVYKMNPKKHTRTKNGHRQRLTRFIVTKISIT